MVKTLAIVGGGPSGLIASYLLQRQSQAEALEISLFEAQDRLGGKVLTGQFSSVPVAYEAGAAEFYQYGQTDPLWLMISRTLGLRTLRMHGSLACDAEPLAASDREESAQLHMFGSTVVLGERIIRGKRDVIQHLGQAAWAELEAFHQRACAQRSREDFIDSGWPADNRHPWAKCSWASILDGLSDEGARHYLETLCHSDLATEPHLTSGLYGLDNYLINDDRYCSLYCVEGGMERLIDALAERVRADIRLRSAVTSIGRSEVGGYRVAWQHDGVADSQSFDAVIVALPNNALPHIDWQGDGLSAVMRSHHAYYDDPAHYLRVSVLFERPFWRGQIQESFFMHDALGGCCVYDEGTRHETGEYGVLGWLVAGNAALEMSNLDDAALIERAVDSLPSSMGNAREHFVEGSVHRWIGAIAARPGGRVIRGSKKRHRPEAKRHPGLFVVGDYLFDATINGLFDSAEIVSKLALKQLQVPRTALDVEYFDYYDEQSPYGESFKVAFDPDYVTSLIETVWGRTAPYRLLDSGSANGLTIPALAERGVEAWGIENNWYIHAQTPTEWLERNLAGDVCEMPFEDGFFEFAYDTCLAHVPPNRVEAAIQELHRVTRYGVFLGTVVKDFRPDIVKKYDLFYGTNSLYTLEQWSELFLRNGFRLAASEPMLSRLWEIEREANDGETWYPSHQSMRYCFYTKVNGCASNDSPDEASQMVAKD